MMGVSGDRGGVPKKIGRVEGRVIREIAPWCVALLEVGRGGERRRRW